jgi:hypothetical protein
MTSAALFSTRLTAGIDPAEQSRPASRTSNQHPTRCAGGRFTTLCKQASSFHDFVASQFSRFRLLFEPCVLKSGGHVAHDFRGALQFRTEPETVKPL